MCLFSVFRNSRYWWTSCSDSHSVYGIYEPLCLYPVCKIEPISWILTSSYDSNLTYSIYWIWINSSSHDYICLFLIIIIKAPCSYDGIYWITGCVIHLELVQLVVMVLLRGGDSIYCPMNPCLACDGAATDILQIFACRDWMDEHGGSYTKWCCYCYCCCGSATDILQIFACRDWMDEHGGSCTKWCCYCYCRCGCSVNDFVVAILNVVFTDIVNVNFVVTILGALRGYCC